MEVGAGEPKLPKINVKSAFVPSHMEHSLLHTLRIIQELDLATHDECMKVRMKVRGKWELGQPADAVEVLARMQGRPDEILDESIERISQKLAGSCVIPPARIPFASRFEMPMAFYDKYPDLQKLARNYKAPVLYAEEADVIGIGSVNPYFAEAFAQSIEKQIFAQLGTKPIITIVRLEPVSWQKLCKTHFKI
ncbi:hypothetical protein [Persicirhabdus sediminis]|uniref:Uncharacterized protein n=1 Tax=Persicirhabdus sediminis TaxID=454144 RepID=A0A8J7SHV5_9BACT|nr:hypothetical protein [Persicirhabdus sediminis]MBK1790109.1 hypothetical protein [Persicirhabdus sediminis]